jgi:alkylated DNA repair dioxygenase AlkB
MLGSRADIEWRRLRGEDQMATQLAMFASDRPWRTGLRYQPDFVSTDEEQELIARLRQLPLIPFQFGAFEGKRRIVSFGWRCDYAEHTLREAEELPTWLMPFVKRVEAFACLPTGAIRQVLCTEYSQGVGIGWHRDKNHFEHVFGLSLVSSCKLRFRRKSGDNWERFTLETLPRSLYMMAGEPRGTWKHSIPPVDHLRFSITFRTMATDAMP